MLRVSYHLWLRIAEGESVRLETCGRIPPTPSRAGTFRSSSSDLKLDPSESSETSGRVLPCARIVESVCVDGDCINAARDEVAGMMGEPDRQSGPAEFG